MPVAKKKQSTLVVEFTKAKETKGTFVYAENEDNGEVKIGSLYVKKAAAAELGNPESLTVTIEVA